RPFTSTRTTCFPGSITSPRCRTCTLSIPAPTPARAPMPRRSEASRRITFRCSSMHWYRPVTARPSESVTRSALPSSPLSFALARRESTPDPPAFASGLSAMRLRDSLRDPLRRLREGKEARMRQPCSLTQRLGRTRRCRLLRNKAGLDGTSGQPPPCGVSPQRLGGS
ncbi:hypothetical protein NGA_2079200, partial [Nannochloropsis gaditana CCMP526]|uniref:uncharacterized protein n=1 Tax=Nannochloropsis gaditana (strain CCMP526) TaxID=1093141 RepID=UPI00029F7271